MPKKRLIRCPVKTGAPSKSYIYVLDLDKLLKKAMSILSLFPVFDCYIASYLNWKRRYNNRIETIDQYLRFFICDSPERVNFLIRSRVVSRTDIIKIIEDTLEENNFLSSNAMTSFFLRRSLKPILLKVKGLISLLYSHYNRYIVKGLMLRRCGVNNPRKLKTNAYYVLLNMLNSYDYRRSKIPFNRFLNYSIMSEKNKIIKYETWDLSGKLESIDGKILTYNSPVDKDDTLNIIKKYLPESFLAVLTLYFNIIDPLSSREELQLLLDNKD